MEEDIKTTLEVTKVATDSKTITRETTQVAILLDLMLWVVVVDLQRMDKRMMSLKYITMKSKALLPRELQTIRANLLELRVEVLIMEEWKL